MKIILLVFVLDAGAVAQGLAVGVMGGGPSTDVVNGTTVIARNHRAHAHRLCSGPWPSAPGWARLGYALCNRAGLVHAGGHDTYAHRIVFPLESNLYGPSIAD
jgi:hypothetical protein